MSDNADKNENKCQEGGQKEDEGRKLVAGRVRLLRQRAASTTALSPVSEIALTLGESTLATPTTTKPKASRIGELMIREMR